MPQNETQSSITRLAREYLQTMGYHAFSYQMIADKLGIKKPSIYHYFASKEDLGLHIIQQYFDWFESWKLKVSNDDPRLQLQKYFQIFENFAKDHEKLCPLGALSVDRQNLPPKMQHSLQGFFDHQVQWIKKCLSEKKFPKEVHSDPAAWACFVMSTLQGGLVSARLAASSKRFTQTRKTLEHVLNL